MCAAQVLLSLIRYVQVKKVMKRNSLNNNSKLKVGINEKSVGRLKENKGSGYLKITHSVVGHSWFRCQLTLWCNNRSRWLRLKQTEE